MQVICIQVCTNNGINKEWISDKTQHACDGLRFQHLTMPLIKQGDRFVATSWEDAIGATATGRDLTDTNGARSEPQGLANDSGFSL
jgi:NADH dehydrogenase (ubiquinone) Fe-S protein 1